MKLSNEITVVSFIVAACSTFVGVWYFMSDVAARSEAAVERLGSEISELESVLEDMRASQALGTGFRAPFDPAPYAWDAPFCLSRGNPVHTELPVVRPAQQPRRVTTIDADQCFHVPLEPGEQISVALPANTTLCSGPISVATKYDGTRVSYASGFFRFSDVVGDKVRIADEMAGFNHATLTQGRFAEMHAPRLGGKVMVRYDGPQDTDVEDLMLSRFTFFRPTASQSYCIW